MPAVDIFDEVAAPKEDVFDTLDVFDTVSGPDDLATRAQTLADEASSAEMDRAQNPTPELTAKREAARNQFLTARQELITKAPEHPLAKQYLADDARVAREKAQTFEEPSAVANALDSPEKFAERAGLNAIPALSAIGAMRALTVKGLQPLLKTATVGEKIVRGLTHAAPVAGAVAGGGLTGLAQEKVLSIGEKPEETEQRYQRTERLGESTEGKLADLVTAGALFRPSASTLTGALRGEAAAMQNVGAGMGVAGAMTTANAALEGRLPTPKELAGAVVEGGIFNTPTRLSRALLGHREQLRPLAPEEARIVATEGIDALETKPAATEPARPVATETEIGAQVKPVLDEAFGKLRKAIQKEDMAKELGNNELLAEAQGERKQLEDELLLRFGTESEFQAVATITDRLNKGTHTWEEGYGLKRISPAERPLNQATETKVTPEGVPLVEGATSPVSEMTQPPAGENIDGGAYRRPLPGEPVEGRNMGPGASNAEEFGGGQRNIGTYNAAVDAQRAERGLPPLMSEARKSNETTWDAAVARVEKDPELPRVLTDQLLSGERKAVSSEDQAVLGWRMVDLRNKRNQAAERLLDDSLTPEEHAEAASEFHQSEMDLQRTEEADRKFGTEWGRTGQFRQRLLNDDFTLGPMMGRAVVAKGEPLTREEAQAVKAESETIQKAEAAKVEQTKAVDEKQSMAAAKAAVTKEARYHPKVLEYAEGIVSRWETEAVKAKADLMQLFGMNVSANPIQPKAIAALFKMARAKIARGALNAADFATEMVQTFGEKVKPFIQPAWDKALKNVDALGKPERPKTAKQKTKEADGTKAAEATEAGITAAAGEGTTLDALRPYVKRLAKDYIKSGVNTVEGLETKLHEFFSKILPDVTPRELRDIFSDYGTGQPAPTDPVRVTGAQLRSESQKLSALEDLNRQLAGEMEKKGVPPSGDKRVPMSDRARQLTKKINELKKELGIVEGDPAKRLSSALESMEKRTENRIRDLRFEIASGERIAKQKGESPTSPKLEALRAELAEVQKEHEAVFGKREMSEEQQLKNAIAAAERAEKAATEELRDARQGVFRTPPAKGKANAALEAVRARTKAARAELSELKALDPASQARAEQQAINARKTQLSKRAADYAERTARNDFGPRTRKELDLSKDPEAVRLQSEANAAKKSFEKRRFEWQQAQRTKLRKGWDTLKDTLGTSRTLMTTADVSAPFRQGGFIMMGDLVVNPARAARQIGEMFRDMRSQKGFDDSEAAIRMRPNAEVYEAAGLHLSDPHGKFTQREENMRSELAEKIPLAGAVVRGSNRAYAGFLNRQRADTMDAFISMMGGKDKVTPETAKYMAEAINDMTGRSEVAGKAVGAANWLARYLFSPRFLMSRFKLLIGEPVWRDLTNGNISPKARAIVALQYGKFAAGLAAFLGLAKWSGAEIELDPRSSDFLKAKFGNTRIDPVAGIQQVGVMLARVLGGKTKTASGKIQDLRGPGRKYGQQDTLKVVSNFARSKLAPIPAVTADWLTGQTMDFQEPTAVGTAQRLAVPISYQDVGDLYRKHGPVKATIMQMMNLLGVGVQHYSKK